LLRKGAVLAARRRADLNPLTTDDRRLVRFVVAMPWVLAMRYDRWIVVLVVLGVVAMVMSGG
jgi:hypothetical protein